MECLAVLMYDCGCKHSQEYAFSSNLKFKTKNGEELEESVNKLIKRLPSRSEKQHHPQYPIEISIFDEKLNKIVGVTEIPRKGEEPNERLSGPIISYNGEYGTEHSIGLNPPAKVGG